MDKRTIELLRSLRGWAVVFAFGFVILGILLPDTPNHYKIVCIGDSITCGRPGFDPNYTLPTGMNEKSQYEYWLSKKFPEHTFINKGVSGNSSRDMLKRFKGDVIDLHPRYVIILGGINDNLYHITLQESVQNIRKMVTMAQDANITPILCTITPCGKYQPLPINDEIRRIAHEKSLVCPDLYHALLDKNRLDYCAPQYTTDNLHPSILGYRVIANTIAKAMTEAKVFDVKYSY